MLGRWRLLGPDIEARACDTLVAQRVEQGGFVVNEAARGGDEIGVRLHQGKFARADHAPALLGQRTIDRHIVGAA